MSSSLFPGTCLGRYEIRSKIGAGGMGEVYLAQDTKLDRRVALKILPVEVAAHQERMRRFVQEAKTASALNHPNIITIYEIEQIDSVNFIATEFIDGVTLRERMGKAPLKLSEVLDVAIQTASALSAAHAAGIIHRDIKPENIMLRRDGIVKVLDFGLAKLSERTDTRAVDTEAATKALVQTEPGVVLGTVAYMSPEQARGLVVDARTDIFSLGVVIYEMVAGRAPFGGATKSDLIAALLERDPPPLARFAHNVPDRMEEIVTKALTKDREERHQSAKDLLIDLKRLRQKLVVDAEIERSVAPLDKFGVPPSDGLVTDAKSSPPEGGTPKAHPTTTTGEQQRDLPVVAPPRASRGWRMLVLFGLLIVAAVAAGALISRLLSPQASSPPVVRLIQTIPSDQVPSGQAGNRLALSPDWQEASVCSQSTAIRATD
jgi:serine/threonine protein kinase